jgi:hypothetical protein
LKQKKIFFKSEHGRRFFIFLLPYWSSPTFPGSGFVLEDEDMAIVRDSPTNPTFHTIRVLALCYHLCSRQSCMPKSFVSNAESCCCDCCCGCSLLSVCSNLA